MSNDNQKIQLQLKLMVQKKQILMDLVRSLPEEIYRRQPGHNHWSPAQIANHLYLSERLSLDYIRKKLSYPDTIPGFSTKSWWSLFLVNFILWSGLKIKAPVKINMWDHQEVLSPEELDLKWNLVRAEIANVIYEHQPGFRNHLVFNHPFSGRMTMWQMLIFFNHHIAHHLRQLRRIIKKIS